MVMSRNRNIANDQKLQADETTGKLEAPNKMLESNIKLLLCIIRHLQDSGEDKISINWKQISQELDFPLKPDAARKRFSSMKKRHGELNEAPENQGPSVETNNKRKANAEPEQQEDHHGEDTEPEHKPNDDTAATANARPKARKTRKKKAEKTENEEEEVKQKRGMKGKSTTIAEKAKQVDSGLMTPPLAAEGSEQEIQNDEADEKGIDEEKEEQDGQ